MPAPRHPRLRSDLTWRRFVTEGADSYIFKDDISQAYVKLDEISGGIALQLDGKTSAEELLTWAQAQWPGLEFDADYIADVLADLERYRFIEDPFQRNALLRARAFEERAQINANTFKNIFSISMGSVNPDRFLDRTHRYIGWFFTAPFVALGLVIFLSSLWLVVMNRDHLESQAASLVNPAEVSALRITLVFLSIMVAIIIHELGHAYAVKHYGGKVQKIGFMCMVLLPCMYCDTSDSHLFPDWKHRAYVALSGTYTELYVAAICTLIWWATPSGLIVNEVAYNVMLFASSSGIIFNYNPLIKLDGYFVLADYLDMPNLQEDAFAYLGYLFKRYILGMREEPCPVEGRRRKRVLAIYGAASLAYTLGFTFFGFFLLRGILIRNFAFVGALAAAVFLVLILKSLGSQLAGTSRGWLLNHRGAIRRRQLPLLAGLLLAVAALVLVPVPGRRVITIALEPIRVAALVAPEELRLKEANWTAGQVVAPGEKLASLDPDLAVAERGEAQAAAQELRISGATARHSGDAGHAVSAQAGEVAARQRSQLLARRVERAELRAPFAGRVLTASMPGVMDERYAAGDTVCVIGDFTRVKATARLLESDLEDVRVGAPVRIRLRIRPGEVLAGRVTDIEPPAEEVRGLRVYPVRIALEGRPRDARAGLTGRAWIATPARPVIVHVLHFLAHFIRLDLWV